MATKAQQFRHEQERSKPGRPPRAKRKKRNLSADTALPGVSASDRLARGSRDQTRNVSKHGERKATVATEENRSGTPSRKSTRASANRGKNSTQLEYAAHQRLVQPSARHQRRG